jgi:predicted DNA-binding transcriptional regulator AlpA
MSQNTNSVELRTARKVRSQLGDISDVSLWRWIRNPTLKFPKPTKISGRLYFRADEIDAWIEAQAESHAQARLYSAEAEKDGNEEEEEEGEEESEEPP